MLAQDFQPQNRIEVAREKVKQFVRMRSSDRIGVVAFSGEHHAIGRDQRLDAATRLRFGGKKGINDRIGDAIANLVGMTFRHRFAGEHKIAAGQEFAFREEIKRWR